MIDYIRQEQTIIYYYYTWNTQLFFYATVRNAWWNTSVHRLTSLLWGRLYKINHTVKNTHTHPHKYKKKLQNYQCIYKIDDTLPLQSLTGALSEQTSKIAHRLSWQKFPALNFFKMSNSFLCDAFSLKNVCTIKSSTTILKIFPENIFITYTLFTFV